MESVLEGCGDVQKVLMINTGEGVMGIPPQGGDIRVFKVVWD